MVRWEDLPGGSGIIAMARVRSMAGVRRKAAVRLGGWPGDVLSALLLQGSLLLVLALALPLLQAGHGLQDADLSRFQRTGHP